MSRLLGAVGLIAAFCAAQPPKAGAAPPVGWVELGFSARKLLVSAETTVRVEAADAAAVAARLEPLAGDEAAGAVAGPLLAVRLDSDLPFGRDETAVAWVRPDSGEAVASEKRGQGRRKVWKASLYRADGMAEWRAVPASPEEADLPPSAWSQRKRETVRWEASDRVVTDSYALLWLVARVPREEPGGSLEVAVLADERLVEVELVAGALHELEADFEQVGADGAVRRRTGPLLAREIRIGARAVSEGGPKGSVDLGFMGMRGEISAFVDLETGVPVEVRGRIGGVGQVTVRLRRAVLAR